MDAEAIYRQLLTQDPDNADALHLLGALAGQCGKPEPGIRLIRQAIALRPRYPEAVRNLAVLLAQAGRYDESLAAYQELREYWPESTDILADYANVLVMADRYDEAIPLLVEVLKLREDLPEVHRNLAIAYRKTGKIDLAIAEAAESVRLHPRYAEGHYEHGLALVAAGRLDEAIEEYRTAVSCKPTLEQAHLNLGKTLGDVGRTTEAIEVYELAVKIVPGSGDLYYNLAQLLRVEERFREAADAYNAAIRLKPDNAAGYAYLAMTLCRLNRTDEAEAAVQQARRLAPDTTITLIAQGEVALNKLDPATAIAYFRQATEKQPDDYDPWCRLGTALLSQGAFDEAARCFRKALELRPDLVSTYQNLARTGVSAVGDAEVAKLLQTLQNEDIAAEDRAGAEFALGKSADEANHYDEAFEHYINGNEIVKKARAARGVIYFPEKFTAMVDEMVDVYTPEYFQARRDWGDPSDIPVFIVGMPRSGTTLVHQIAASHQAVHGAGELTYIRDIAGSLGGNDAREAALGWTREKIRSNAEMHLARLRAMGPDALRIVDKLPENVIFLGLISVMYPNARVIFCRRDPRDTCLSNYFQNFTGILYSFDLANCGHHLVHTYRLMDHFLKVLPLKHMEMQYEELVADLEGQSRRLIDFLGLPWDPACLEFHRTDTGVLTASMWQVRQPVYSSSVGRWRKYEKFLGPMLEKLKGLPPGVMKD